MVDIASRGALHFLGDLLFTSLCKLDALRLAADCSQYDYCYKDDHRLIDQILSAS